MRFHGSLPDDEEALQALIEQHKVSNANIYVLLPKEKVIVHNFYTLAALVDLINK